MMWFRIVALGALALVLSGCGSGTPSTRVEEPPAQDQIRSALEHVANTGVVDSGLMLVREKLEEMKSSDAAKAEALLKDLAQLEKMGNQPAQAKAKAQEMLGKL